MRNLKRLHARRLTIALGFVLVFGPSTDVISADLAQTSAPHAGVIAMVLAPTFDAACLRDEAQGSNIVARVRYQQTRLSCRSHVDAARTFLSVLPHLANRRNKTVSAPQIGKIQTSLALTARGPPALHV